MSEIDELKKEIGICKEQLKYLNDKINRKTEQLLKLFQDVAMRVSVLEKKNG